MHCVEGGFCLGAEAPDVKPAVHRLADEGVAYITVAHLIWRGVATDAPAIPFLTDEQYRDWFPQPDTGLSKLGRAAVEAMVDEHVLIDVSHMSERALADTFELLDHLDPAKSVPVVATHAGYRFGTQEYMLTPGDARADRRTRRGRGPDLRRASDGRRSVPRGEAARGPRDR